jgi:diguanylate cyclase (GGDEF)-like protein
MKIRTSQSRYADDRYTVQRRAGFPWLRFARDLEDEYRETYIEANATRLRVASGIGLFAIVCFILVDEVFGSNLQPRSADVLLLGVSLPCTLVPLIATFSRRAGGYLMPLMFTAILTMALSIVAVIAIGREANAWFPWESLILVTMFVAFVSGLMFYAAVLVNALVWFAFIGSNWGLQSHDKLLYEGYYLLVANAVGWLGQYLLERHSRLAFLMQNELRQQAVLDSLTGLMNRRSFNAHMEAAWLQAQRGLTSVGLMLVDLDGFKKVNDSCGHQFGDNALQHVAHVLRTSAMRPLDAAGRYGGDEFIAIWYDVDGAWFQKLAEELPARLEGLQCGDTRNPLKVTISGGAVIAWPRPGMQMRDAVKIADETLYEMKRTQRGRIGYVVMRQPQALESQESPPAQSKDQSAA